MSLEYWGGSLELKTVDTQERLIKGYAAVHHNVDRVRDIIDPSASVKALGRIKDLPKDVTVLIAHNSAALPTGIPKKVEVHPKGLYTETYILKGSAGDNVLAIAKDLLDHGLALGMSIGYKTHDSRRETAGYKTVRRIMDYELKEYSLASAQAIANPEALVLAVKAMTAGADSAGGALVPAATATRGGATKVQYRVEQNGDRWIVYCDMDADGDADDNVPVGTYASAEMANAVVVALQKQQSMMAGGMAMDDDEAPGGGAGMEKTQQTPAPEVKAVWSAKEVDALPDSSFLWVEDGGQKDDEGKTVPRSKRHLPYKDASGAIDLPHLRNAIARIPQTDGLDAGKKAQLQARARRLLSAATEGKTSDDSAAAEWAMDGGPLSVAALGYKLVDLSEQLAAELKAMALLGEETKSYQRMRAPARDALRAVAADLIRMADHAERIDKGEDGIARLAWLKQQFALTEV